MNTKHLLGGLLTMMLGLSGAHAAHAQTSDAPVLTETTVQLTAGKAVRLDHARDWNAVAVLSPDGEGLPELEYSLDGKNYVGWHLSHGQWADETITELLPVRTPRQSVWVRAAANDTVGVHFYHTVTAADLLTVEGLTDQLDTRPQFISRAEWDNGACSKGTTESYSLYEGENTFDLSKRATEIAYQAKVKLRQGDSSYDDEIEATEAIHFQVRGESDLPRLTVHHTGESGGVSERYVVDPAAHVRAVCVFHKYSRGWGDIAYHYYIAKNGDIYEGVDGGITESGTHTWNRNKNNIGIVLQGNYNIEEPPDVQIEVLSLLLADHATRLGINPFEKVDYHGREVERIAGHREVAAASHGTSCPGDAIYARMPEIRQRTENVMNKLRKAAKSVVPKARDRLQKSEVVQQYQGYKTKIQPRDESRKLIKRIDIGQPIVTGRGERGDIDIMIENLSGSDILQGESMKASNVPEGLVVTSFRALTRINAGETGVFRAKFYVRNTLPNGEYTLEMSPEFFRRVDYTIARNLALPVFTQTLQVAGAENYVLIPVAESAYTPLSEAFLGKNLTAVGDQAATKDGYTPEMLRDLTATSIVRHENTQDDSPLFRVMIESFTRKYAEVTATEVMAVYTNDNLLTTLMPGQTVKALYTTSNGYPTLSVSIDDEPLAEVKTLSLRTSTHDGVLTVHNHSENLSSANAYNEFRSRLDLYATGSKLEIVNELPIELYLLGLSEEPVTEPLTKREAIIIAARNYAYVYSHLKSKFDTERYHMTNSPKCCQYYLGYGWEKYHPEQAEIVKQTRGVMATVDGVPVVLPYHTQSGGQTSDAWRGQYPHTKSQYLSFDEGYPRKGHGVGMSGRTARAMGNMGKTKEEILRYFFDGIEIEKVYE